MKFVPAVLAFAMLIPTTAMADQVGLVFGGDAYAAGQMAIISAPVQRDAFVAGYNVALSAPVTGSAHLAGYSVNASASVGGDLYAAGFAVSITSPIAGDVTAMGNSVVVNSTTPVSGNARLAGATLMVDTPIAGSLLATASTLTLNAPVSGDFSFYGESISFGPNARVGGNVLIQAPKEIPVPAAVAAPDHVSFQQIAAPDYAGEAGKTAENIVRGFWFAVWAAIAWWLLLLVVGAAFIALAPRLVSDLSANARTRPFRRLGLGTLSFAATIGLVLVTALTVVGIVLLPFVLVYVFVACSLAYLAGVYAVGLRIWTAIVPVETNLRRVVALAVSLVVAGLLTMVPLLGWPITLLLLAFGFGVITVNVISGWTKDDLQSATAASTTSAIGQPSAL